MHAQNITSLRVGDMASGPRHGGLRSSSSFCSRSPVLTNPLGDLRLILNNFKMARFVENDSLTKILPRGSLVENWIYFSLNLNKIVKSWAKLLSVLLKSKWQMRVDHFARRCLARSSWGRRATIRCFDSWVGAVGGCSVLSSNIERRFFLRFDLRNFASSNDHGIPLL